MTDEEILPTSYEMYSVKASQCLPSNSLICLEDALPTASILGRFQCNASENLPKMSSNNLCLRPRNSFQDQAR